MADPSQNSEQLSAEDAQALLAAQQHLASSGDPRADKLRAYMMQSGFGADQNGALQAPPEHWYSGTLSGTAPWQQAIDKAAQTQPVNSVGAAMGDIGAGATRMMLEPIAHPLNTLEGLNPVTATPGAVKFGESLAPQRGEQPTPYIQRLGGEALAAAPQVAMAAAGSGAVPESGEASAANPPGGPGIVRSTAARLFPSFVDGSPESMLTKAIKPGKNNVGWNGDIQTAVPLMKSAEGALGHPVGGVDDALQAAQIAKKDIWQQYTSRLGPAGQMGATIDGNSIADAMANSVDQRTALQNPGLLAKVNAIADTYRRPLNLNEAEDFLQSANKDLNSYYAKNKVGQQVAQNDPEISSTVAEAGALRSALYGKLDTLFGPGSAQLKQSYGALSNVEKELYGRQLVAARQNPVSLNEQISTARGAGQIAKGVLTMNPGDIAAGAYDVAGARAIKNFGSTDAMITRAFKAAQPAQPFPMAAAPQIRGLLDRGSIQMGAPPEGPYQGTPQPNFSPDTRAARLGKLLPAQSGAPNILPYYPEMTPGERVAALMQQIRSQPARSLPAQSIPLQLPASFK